MADVAEPEVEVRRSKRRRRTVSAYRDGDRIVVLIPASFSKADEAEWVGDDGGQARAVRAARAARRRRPARPRARR